MENENEILNGCPRLLPLWIIALATLWLVGSNSRAQIPNGFWQARESLVGDWYDNGYQFGDSAKFEYHISAYDILNPLRSFGGHYAITSDTITFCIEYYDILEDITIDLDYVSSWSDNWEVWPLYEAYKEKRVFLPSLNRKAMKYTLCNDTLFIGDCDFHLINENWWNYIDFLNKANSILRNKRKWLWKIVERRKDISICQ